MNEKLIEKLKKNAPHLSDVEIQSVANAIYQLSVLVIKISKL
jgi:hypothetical protein